MEVSDLCRSFKPSGQAVVFHCDHRVGQSDFKGFALGYAKATLRSGLPKG